MQKIIIGLKELKIKIKKKKKKGRRTKKKKERKKKKENSTELQKPNVEAEDYNNKKNVTEKIKKLKSLIRFQSANKIYSYNRQEKREKKRKKIQKNLQDKSKHKNNKCFS